MNRTRAEALAYQMQQSAPPSVTYVAKRSGIEDAWYVSHVQGGNEIARTYRRAGEALL